MRRVHPGVAGKGWGWAAQRRQSPQSTADRIAADLLACRDVLNLRTRRLVADIRSRYGVATSTACNALSMARRSA